MAYEKKNWTDRVSQYPTRRTLTPVSGQANVFDVTRSEGQVATDGDAFDAETMNSLENRIDSEFERVNSSINGLNQQVTTISASMGQQVNYQWDGTTLNIITK